MRQAFILATMLTLVGCSKTPPRPEDVAVKYAEQRWGREFFDPQGKGYNINVVDCGTHWCVQLAPFHDPKSLEPRFTFGGEIELELRKTDLAVTKQALTQ